MLTPERIESIFLEHGWHWSGKPGMYTPIGRAIEAEVRKDDTELIRQLLEALDGSIAITMAKIDMRNEAIAAARARLEQPCA